MDSICLTWLEHESRYLVTFLPRDGSPLIKRYVDSMPEFIELIAEIEEEISG